MNITFPHLNIPIHKFAFSILIGLSPWNYFTCKAGSIISTLKSRSDIMKTENYIMVIFI
jgi:hypothetical protein